MAAARRGTRLECEERTVEWIGSPEALAAVRPALAETAATCEASGAALGVFKVIPARLTGLGERALSVVDSWGLYSAAEQGLAGQLTTVRGLAPKDEEEVHLVVASGTPVASDRAPRIVGLLKTGLRDLWLRDRSGAFVQAPRKLCVLDIAVHPSARRNGVAVAALEAVLGSRGGAVASAAVDRPSAAMQALLAHRFAGSFGEGVIEQDCRFWVATAEIERLKAAERGGEQRPEGEETGRVRGSRLQRGDE